MIFIFYIFGASRSVANMKEMFPVLNCFYYIMEACECSLRHGVALSQNVPIRCRKSRKCFFPSLSLWICSQAPQNTTTLLGLLLCSSHLHVARLLALLLFIHIRSRSQLCSYWCS